MKNILVITTLYPNPFSKFDTPVIHYFAREWQKSGHNVVVIHYQSVFPPIFYWIAKLFPRLVEKIIKTDFFQTERRTKDVCYTKDNVTIYSFPILKFLPHGRYSKKTISKQVSKIINTLKDHEFVPDIITGHFYNPQIEIVSNLKKRQFSNARTCIVLHENPEIILKKYPRDYPQFFENIDKWGFRFHGLKAKFESIFGNGYNTFMCYSGIPDEYILSSKTQKNFNSGINKFCFIGMLIPLKRVNDSIIALDKAFANNKNFEFTIVGQGMEMENLKKLALSLNLNTNIEFTGKIGRDDVQEKLKACDCYIMVSESEAFGLVYLEAMSKGCITIGTKGQGIDGIIIHGVNGFLCESGNPDKLAELISDIQSLTVEELSTISQNAINTTLEMSDRKVAESYFNNIAY